MKLLTINTIQSGDNAGKPATFKGLTPEDTLALGNEILGKINTFELNNAGSGETSRQLNATCVGDDGLEYRISVCVNRSLGSADKQASKFATQMAKKGADPVAIANAILAKFAPKA